MNKKRDIDGAINFDFNDEAQEWDTIFELN